MIARWAKVGIGVVAVVGATTAVVLAVKPSYAPTAHAVVTGYQGGDTFLATVDGVPQEVRLINIEAPEPQTQDTGGQCLGTEAALHLGSLIPVGTSVRLEFEERPHDRYGRVLAGAYLDDGRMLNAELAKAGLARVDHDDDARFHDVLDSAWLDAAANHRGLHSTEIACTLPARSKQLADALAQMPRASAMAPNLSAAELYVAADRANLVRQTASALRADLDNAGNHISWQALTPEAQRELSELATSTEDTAIREEVALRGLAAVAESRDGANRAITALEADRIARERAAIRAAQERLAAQRAAADRAAAQRAAAERAAAARAAAQREAERTPSTRTASSEDEDTSSSEDEDSSENSSDSEENSGSDSGGDEGDGEGSDDSGGSRS